MDLETMYLIRKPRLNRVCVLEDIDFYFEESELRYIRKMWKEEIGVIYIAEKLERDPDEVLMALVHLARQERIFRRKRGLLR